MSLWAASPLLLRSYEVCGNILGPTHVIPIADIKVDRTICIETLSSGYNVPQNLAEIEEDQIKGAGVFITPVFIDLSGPEIARMPSLRLICMSETGRRQGYCLTLE
ncbi:hypothetical protein [Sinorhizobium terangae]|uniref:hypothetical protein n=1 Tax=Sinorhizobium terangae TaxID=110322 RepID=UPI001F31AFAE|nr:hypothetical protein [Sinorhizobium terangae]